MKELKMSELFDSLKDDEWISSFLGKYEGKKFVTVVDLHGHIKRIFERKNVDTLVELDVEQIIDEIAEYLKDSINVKDFLKDVVATQPGFDLMELFERIHNKKPKVKPEEGCYNLLVYGKRGRPFKLWLNRLS